MQFKLKSTRCFLTSDNNSFTSESDAKLHEAGLALFSRITSGAVSGVASNADVKRACLVMAKNYKAFADVFEAIRRVKRNS